MPGLLLGLDIGTSSVKALLAEANATATVVASVVQSYPNPVSQPRPGWSEQHPDDWWQGCVAAIAQVCKVAKRKPSEIVAVGLSGQMHGSVFLDRAGTVIRPAMLWNDQRTTAECAQIESAVGGRAKLIELVNNPALTGYTLPKILWFRGHDAKRFDKLAHVLLPKDFIRFKLSGALLMDVADASGTLLLDVKSRTWCKPLISALDLDPKLFPPLVESDAEAGQVSSLAAKLTGIPEGTPISGGAGDQPAGAVGNGITRSGIISATLGTSGVLFAHADKPVPNEAGALQSFCHAVRDKWCVFGCMLSAGGSLQWFKETLGQAEVAEAKKTKADAYALLIERASEAKPGCEGLFFLPYLTGERCPYPDPCARGGWIGLTARHHRDHLIRSVVEGITFGLKDQVELMRAGGVKVEQVRASGGGARSPWWCQLMADVFDAEIVTTNSTEGGAYGAALLGGVAAGIYPTVDAICAKAIKPAKRWKPNVKRVATYNQLHATYQKLYRDLQATFPLMASA